MKHTRRVVKNAGMGRFAVPLLAFLLAVVFSVGTLTAFWQCRMEDQRIRSSFLTQTRMLAQMIPRPPLQQLSGSPEDAQSPVYQTLKTQLMAVRSLNPQCRFIYLLGQRGSRVFFFMDSEPPESKDYSPPGQEYSEAAEPMRRVFHTGIESVVGPYSDRWGTWVSAVAPLRHPDTGELLALFAMDVDARDWRNHVREHALPALLTSLLIAVLLSFFFELLRRSSLAVQRITASESALKEKTDELDRYFDAALDLFCIADTNGYFRRLNKQWEVTLGYPLHELKDRPFLELVHPEDQEATLNAVSRLNRQEKVLSFTNRYRCADGTYRWLEWRSLPQGTTIYAAARDITERKQAEESLRALTHRQQVLLSAIPDIIMEVDANKVYAWANPAGLDFFGDDVIGREASYYFEGEQHVYDSVQPLFNGNDDVIYVESLQRRRDGEKRLLAWWCRVLKDEHGTVTGALSSARDITDHMRAVEERKKLESQLRQAQKMEAVGQLAGGVAHDFNNLLQVILGYMDILREELSPESPSGQAIKEVQEAAERAAELTRQLLAFSRRQVIHPVHVNLNELVQGIVKMIRRVIGEHIDLKFLPGESLGTVCVDKGQFEQVLMNLCVNARDAMPSGGILTIETATATLDKEYCHAHPWAMEGRYEVLIITDSGHGMDEATRQQIFDPFFTTKPAGEGTGLGLATVYGIVKQHNGLIHVYSEPGMGATFRIYIPRAGQDALPSAEMESAVPEGGTETILVAEDEETVRKLVGQMLTSAGYTVLLACDGEEALQLFNEHAADIDLVLLDVIMPKLGGGEVMERIRGQHPHMRFLFSSGYSESAIHTGFVMHEGLRLIKKPYAKNDLLSAVREILDTPPQKNERAGL